MEEKLAFKRLLKEMSIRLVMKKEEIIEFFKNDGENPYDLFKVATQALSINGFIQYVNEVGAYVITQKGMKEVVE